MAGIKQFVGCVLGGENYGIDIMNVVEIKSMMDITPIPRAPSFVEGIINLRGVVIPVIDLRKRLQLPVNDANKDMRIIIMRMADKKLGFIVDKVERVMQIEFANIEKAPGVAASVRNYVEGVVNTSSGMVIILDAVKLFSADEAKQLQELF